METLAAKGVLEPLSPSELDHISRLQVQLRRYLEGPEGELVSGVRTALDAGLELVANRKWDPKLLAEFTDLLLVLSVRCVTRFSDQVSHRRHAATPSAAAQANTAHRFFSQHSRHSHDAPTEPGEKEWDTLVHLFGLVHGLASCSALKTSRFAQLAADHALPSAVTNFLLQVHRRPRAERRSSALARRARSSSTLERLADSALPSPTLRATSAAGVAIDELDALQPLDHPGPSPTTLGSQRHSAADLHSVSLLSPGSGGEFEDIEIGRSGSAGGSPPAALSLLGTATVGSRMRLHSGGGSTAAAAAAAGASSAAAAASPSPTSSLSPTTPQLASPPSMRPTATMVNLAQAHESLESQSARVDSDEEAEADAMSYNEDEDGNDGGMASTSATRQEPALRLRARLELESFEMLSYLCKFPSCVHELLVADALKPLILLLAQPHASSPAFRRQLSAFLTVLTSTAPQPVLQYISHADLMKKLLDALQPICARRDKLVQGSMGRSSGFVDGGGHGRGSWGHGDDAASAAAVAAAAAAAASLPLPFLQRLRSLICDGLTLLLYCIRTSAAVDGVLATQLLGQFEEAGGYECCSRVLDQFPLTRAVPAVSTGANSRFAPTSINAHSEAVLLDKLCSQLQHLVFLGPKDIMPSLQSASTHHSRTPSSMTPVSGRTPMGSPLASASSSFSSTAAAGSIVSPPQVQSYPLAAGIGRSTPPLPLSPPPSASSSLVRNPRAFAIFHRLLLPPEEHHHHQPSAMVRRSALTSVADVYSSHVLNAQALADSCSMDTTAAIVAMLDSPELEADPALAREAWRVLEVLLSTHAVASPTGEFSAAQICVLLRRQQLRLLQQLSGSVENNFALFQGSKTRQAAYRFLRGLLTGAEEAEEASLSKREQHASSSSLDLTLLRHRQDLLRTSGVLESVVAHMLSIHRAIKLHESQAAAAASAAVVAAAGEVAAASAAAAAAASEAEDGSQAVVDGYSNGGEERNDDVLLPASSLFSPTTHGTSFSPISVSIAPVVASTGSAESAATAESLTELLPFQATVLDTLYLLLLNHPENQVHTEKLVRAELEKQSALSFGGSGSGSASGAFVHPDSLAAFAPITSPGRHHGHTASWTSASSPAMPQVEEETSSSTGEVLFALFSFLPSPPLSLLCWRDARASCLRLVALLVKSHFLLVDPRLDVVSPLASHGSLLPSLVDLVGTIPLRDVEGQALALIALRHLMVSAPLGGGSGHPCVFEPVQSAVQRCGGLSALFALLENVHEAMEQQAAHFAALHAVQNSSGSPTDEDHSAAGNGSSGSGGGGIIKRRALASKRQVSTPTAAAASSSPISPSSVVQSPDAQEGPVPILLLLRHLLLTFASLLAFHEPSRAEWAATGCVERMERALHASKLLSPKGGPLVAAWLCWLAAEGQLDALEQSSFVELSPAGIAAVQPLLPFLAPPNALDFGSMPLPVVSRTTLLSPRALEPALRLLPRCTSAAQHRLLEWLLDVLRADPANARSLGTSGALGVILATFRTTLLEEDDTGSNGASAFAQWPVQSGGLSLHAGTGGAGMLSPHTPRTPSRGTGGGGGAGAPVPSSPSLAHSIRGALLRIVGELLPYTNQGALVQQFWALVEQPTRDEDEQKNEHSDDENVDAEERLPVHGSMLANLLELLRRETDRGAGWPFLEFSVFAPPLQRNLNAQSGGPGSRAPSTASTPINSPNKGAISAVTPRGAGSSLIGVSSPAKTPVRAGTNASSSVTSPALQSQSLQSIRSPSTSSSASAFPIRDLSTTLLPDPRLHRHACLEFPTLLPASIIAEIKSGARATSAPLPIAFPPPQGWIFAAWVYLDEHDELDVSATGPLYRLLSISSADAALSLFVAIHNGCIVVQSASSAPSSGGSSAGAVAAAPPSTYYRFSKPVLPARTWVHVALSHDSHRANWFGSAECSLYIGGAFIERTKLVYPLAPKAGVNAIAHVGNPLHLTHTTQRVPNGGGAGGTAAAAEQHGAAGGGQHFVRCKYRMANVLLAAGVLSDQAAAQLYDFHALSATQRSRTVGPSPPSILAAHFAPKAGGAIASTSAADAAADEKVVVAHYVRMASASFHALDSACRASRIMLPDAVAAGADPASDHLPALISVSDPPPTPLWGRSVPSSIIPASQVLFYVSAAPFLDVRPTNAASDGLPVAHLRNFARLAVANLPPAGSGGGNAAGALAVPDAVVVGHVDSYAPRLLLDALRDIGGLQRVCELYAHCALRSRVTEASRLAGMQLLRLLLSMLRNSPRNLRAFERMGGHEMLARTLRARLRFEAAQSPSLPVGLRWIDRPHLDLLFALLGLGDQGRSGCIVSGVGLRVLVCEGILPLMHLLDDHPSAAEEAEDDATDHSDAAAPGAPLASYFLSVLRRAISENPDAAQRADSLARLREVHFATLLVERCNLDKAREARHVSSVLSGSLELLPRSVRTGIFTLLGTMLSVQDLQLSELQCISDFIVKISGSAARHDEDDANDVTLRPVNIAEPPPPSTQQEETQEDEAASEEEEQQLQPATPDVQSAAHASILRQRLHQLSLYRSEIRNSLLQLLLSLVLQAFGSTAAPAAGGSVPASPAATAAAATPSTPPRHGVTSGSQAMYVLIRVLSPTWFISTLHDLRALVDAMHAFMQAGAAAAEENAEDHDPSGSPTASPGGWASTPLPHTYVHSVLLLLQLLGVMLARFPPFLDVFRRQSGFEGLRMLLEPENASLAAAGAAAEVDEGDDHVQHPSAAGAEDHSPDAEASSSFTSLESFVPSFFTALLCHNIHVRMLLAHVLFGMDCSGYVLAPPGRDVIDEQHEATMAAAGTAAMFGSSGLDDSVASESGEAAASSSSSALSLVPLLDATIASNPLGVAPALVAPEVLPLLFSLANTDVVHRCFSTPAFSELLRASIASPVLREVTAFCGRLFAKSEQFRSLVCAAEVHMLPTPASAAGGAPQPPTPIVSLSPVLQCFISALFVHATALETFVLRCKTERADSRSASQRVSARGSPMLSPVASPPASLSAAVDMDFAALNLRAATATLSKSYTEPSASPLDLRAAQHTRSRSKSNVDTRSKSMASATTVAAAAAAAATNSISEEPSGDSQPSATVVAPSRCIRSSSDVDSVSSSAPRSRFSSHGGSARAHMAFAAAHLDVQFDDASSVGVLSLLARVCFQALANSRTTSVAGGVANGGSVSPMKPAPSTPQSSAAMGALQRSMTFSSSSSSSPLRSGPSFSSPLGRAHAQAQSPAASATAAAIAALPSSLPGWTLLQDLLHASALGSMHPSPPSTASHRSFQSRLLQSLCSLLAKNTDKVSTLLMGSPGSGVAGQAAKVAQEMLATNFVALVRIVFTQVQLRNFLVQVRGNEELVASLSLGGTMPFSNSGGEGPTTISGAKLLLSLLLQLMRTPSFASRLQAHPATPPSFASVNHATPSLVLSSLHASLAGGDASRAVPGSPGHTLIALLGVLHTSLLHLFAESLGVDMYSTSRIAVNRNHGTAGSSRRSLSNAGLASSSSASAVDYPTLSWLTDLILSHAHVCLERLQHPHQLGVLLHLLFEEVLLRDEPATPAAVSSSSLSSPSSAASSSHAPVTSSAHKHLRSQCIKILLRLLSYPAQSAACWRLLTGHSSYVAERMFAAEIAANPDAFQLLSLTPVPPLPVLSPGQQPLTTAQLTHRNDAPLIAAQTQRGERLRAGFEAAVRGSAAAASGGDGGASFIAWLSSLGAEGRRSVSSLLHGTVGQHFLVLLVQSKAVKRAQSAAIAAARRTQQDLSSRALAASARADAQQRVLLSTHQHEVKRSISTRLWALHAERGRSIAHSDALVAAAAHAPAAGASS